MKHPSPEILERHAAADLPIAAWIVVDAHVETCSACSDRLSGIGGSVGAETPVVLPPVTPELMARAMKVLDAPPSADDDQDPFFCGDAPVPYAFASRGLKPRRWAAPGLWAAFADLPEEDNWRAFLLRAPAGTVIPRHGHGGNEYIAVLSGAFTDGALYAAGDFVLNPEDRDHSLRVTDDGPCVCAIAIKGPMRWRGFARAITPLMGI